jgi:hypothetical protein
VDLLPGPYVLVTGNRLTGGTVLAKLEFFNLDHGKNSDMMIELRKSADPSGIIGKIDRTKFITGITGQKLSVSSDARGLIIAWLEPEKEPSHHFVTDLLLKKEELNKWGGTVFLIFRNDKEKNAFEQTYRTLLPSGTRCFIASLQTMNDFTVAAKIKAGQDLPLVSFINDKGEIIYLSAGYKIGIGDDLGHFLK